MVSVNTPLLLVEPDGGLLVEPPTGSYRVLSSHVDGGL